MHLEKQNICLYKSWRIFIKTGYRIEVIAKGILEIELKRIRAKPKPQGSANSRTNDG